MYRAFEPDPLLGLDELKNLLKTSYILELIMGCVITAAKISILWFYHPIFAVYPMIRKAIYATGAACIIWFIIVTFVFIFQCSPVDAYWNMFAQPPACHKSQQLVLGYELTNFFLDVVILCIPIKPIKALQLSPLKRASTMAIFMLGGFVCIASIIRMTAVYDARDPSREVNFSPAMMWSTIQLGTAIVCSTLPALGPLIRSVSKPLSSLKSQYLSTRSRGKSSKWSTTGDRSGKTNESRDENYWIRMEENSHDRSHDSKDHIPSHAA
ncbi:hypothetical protein BU24DRAFT_425940 [Aaosphaeria arxii CBS 175.79]|uniref:Rhodopsin domain-containing protein n=1 Tax=Aaosphaeria arxii CBS 175.79 TaxID=1450172 RepID=A0A6A5XGW3_9PLEO|nr:uncharacterized protein BU24DRAFT_425940 [Aaosphaeria arxii CBS 175.79]KAF2012106.1 hypothetical protein BU24DRAFT_425940 [Aaosphaeria arxii CBS 175.79]